MSKKRQFHAWLFAGKHGKNIYLQLPNTALIVWIAASIASRLTDGQLADILRTISFASIIVWSLLEILAGDSRFRRLLGATVLVVSAYSRL